MARRSPDRSIVNPPSRPPRPGAIAAKSKKPDPCALCRDKVGVTWSTTRHVTLLRKYLSDRGKIRARRATGTCVQHQGEVSVAIKTARELVVLLYTQRTVTERLGGGRRRGERIAARLPARPGPFP